jgi:hypothetical protein
MAYRKRNHGNNGVMAKGAQWRNNGNENMASASIMAIMWRNNGSKYWRMVSAAAALMANGVSKRK